MAHKNKGHRSAFIQRKSWASSSHKGWGKKVASKWHRAGDRELVRQEIKVYFRG